ncbi:MAG: pyridoxal 5'-phosphate synthase [Planctomycetota bacterium]
MTRSAHAADPFCDAGTLPERLPDSPWPIFESWYTLAREAGPGGGPVQPNPNAMSLATVTPDGQPENRIVLCKWYDAAAGSLVFHTNYQSPKGRSLEHAPRAAVCFHWDPLHRQVRITGPIVRCSAEDSDRYFRTRPLSRRVGAWASEQSEPIGSRRDLIKAFKAAADRFGVPTNADGSIDPEIESDIPCPPHWGGFTLWAERMELWIEGSGRFHDRAHWTRPLSPTAGGGFETGPWAATRIQP